MAKRKGRRPGGALGGPGGMGGVSDMLQQVQQIQEDMAAAQEAMGDETFEVTAGGGAITIVITGHQEVREVRIDPDVIDLDDDEWLEDLQDLVVAAVNQAITHSKEMVTGRMEEIAGPLTGMLKGANLGDLGGMLGG
jgi:DNA-binding YbaB/EbfC family protein